MKRSSSLRAIAAGVSTHGREISIPGPPKITIETVDRARHFGAYAVEFLEATLEAVRRAYHKSYTAWTGSPPEHPAPEIYTSFDFVLRIGAFCVMLFECFCASVLAIITLAVPMPVAILIGVAVTTVFTLTIKAVWHLHIAPDEAHPRRALLTLYRWLMPLFAAWAVALAVALLLPRVVEESTPLVNLCFNIVMSVLTVLSPALSGLLFAAANLYGWSRSQTRSYHDLLGLRRKVAGLLEQCDRVAPPPPGQAIDISRHRDSDLGPPSQAVVLVIAALVAVAQGQAQPRNQFWFDDSKSPDAKVLQSAKDQFFNALPAAIAAGATTWDLFRFSQNAFSARPVATIEVQSFVEPACSAPAAPATEIGTFLRRVRAAEERAREKKCSELRAEAHATHDREMNDAVTKARSEFDSARPEAGACTALLDLLHRVLNDPARTVLIVSDGIESCSGIRGIRLPAPRNATHAILVIIPSKTGRRKLTEWQEFEARKREWGETAPWLDVVTVPQLTAPLMVAARN